MWSKLKRHSSAYSIFPHAYFRYPQSLNKTRRNERLCVIYKLYRKTLKINISKMIFYFNSVGYNFHLDN